MGDFSLIDILKIVLKRVWAVIVAAVLCGSIAMVYCQMLATPTYQAKASVIGSNGNVAADYEVAVNNGEATIESNDLAASIALTDTYVVMLTKMPTESDQFVSLLQEEDLLTQYKNSTVEITAREDTLIIDISVIGTDPKAAMQIANIYAECSANFVADYNIGMIKTLSKARDTIQVSPRTFITVALASILGAVVVALFVIYIELSDRTINGEEDVRSHYDFPILGNVPDFQSTVKGGKK